MRKEKKGLQNLTSIFYCARLVLGFGVFMADLSHTQVPKLKEKLLKSLSSYMKKKGLSQGAVGRLIGIDRRNVNQIFCRSERKVSLDQLIRIANGIGLKAEIALKESSRKRSKDS